MQSRLDKLRMCMQRSRFDGLGAAVVVESRDANVVPVHVDRVARGGRAIGQAVRRGDGPHRSDQPSATDVRAVGAQREDKGEGVRAGFRAPDDARGRHEPRGKREGGAHGRR